MLRSVALRAATLFGSGTSTAPRAYSCGAYFGSPMPHAVTGIAKAKAAATGR